MRRRGWERVGKWDLGKGEEVRSLILREDFVRKEKNWIERDLQSLTFPTRGVIFGGLSVEGWNDWRES